ncbi:MAG: chemotaxis protein CheW, partial [Sphaerospermopsis sp. SIO1G2]|nr:chemotaxis protein CheW [Sphaerospermopsis sp. SIO1G2]
MVESSDNAYRALLVTCGDNLLALPLNAISEVVEIEFLTHVPLVPPAVVGLSQVRGSALPVVDGSQLFGGSTVETELTHHVNRPCLTIESAGWRIGLLVDHIHHRFHTSESLVTSLDNSDEVTFSFSGSISVPGFEQRAFLVDQDSLELAIQQTRTW